MSGPYRDSSESLLLPQAGTATGGNDTPARAPSFRQHRIIPALRLKRRSGGSPRQEPPQAAVALRSASLRLGVRHGICVAKMLDNVGLRYPHRASGTKAPRTLRPLPLLRFAVSATGGAHLCSIQYYLRFWLSSCRTSLAVSALRIMRYCLSSIIVQRKDKRKINLPVYQRFILAVYP